MSALGVQSTCLVARRLDMSNVIGTAAIDPAPGTQTQVLRPQSACFVTHCLGVSTTAGGWTIKSTLGPHSTCLVARRLDVSNVVGAAAIDPAPGTQTRLLRLQSAYFVTHRLGVSTTAGGWTIKSALGAHSTCLVARRLDMSNVIGTAAIDPAPGTQTRVLRPQSAYFVTHRLGVLTTAGGWTIKSMLGAHSTWLVARRLDVSNEVGTAAIDLAPGTQTRLLRLQSACFITHRLGVSTTAGGWTIKSALGAHSTWLVARRLNVSKEVGMGLNDPTPQKKARESRTQSVCPVTRRLGMSNVT